MKSLVITWLLWFVVSMFLPVPLTIKIGVIILGPILIALSLELWRKFGTSLPWRKIALRGGTIVVLGLLYVLLRRFVIFIGPEIALMIKGAIQWIWELWPYILLLVIVIVLFWPRGKARRKH